MRLRIEQTDVKPITAAQPGSGKMLFPSSKNARVSPSNFPNPVISPLSLIERALKRDQRDPIVGLVELSQSSRSIIVPPARQNSALLVTRFTVPAPPTIQPRSLIPYA